MTKWTKKRLADIADSCLGKMLDKEKNKGEYKPYLANLNVQWGEFKLESLQQMRFEEREKERYGLKYGDLVICEGGEPGRCAIWRDEKPDMMVQKALHRLRVHPKYSSDFLYYRMKLAGMNRELDRHFIGSTIKHLTGIGLKDVEFEFPDFKEQKSIAVILRSLDKKIEINNKINAELEAMAKLIYDYWFVQFDFPDANGKPYKSSGGKMVYNQELKREIPEGWSVETLSKNLNIYDSIRVPMSKKERETKKGIYPYFGATSIMDHVDDFLFDDDYILLAEDGSIMDDKGMPIVQFIWGKTWVNNHAHVLQAKSKEQNEFYFQSLKQIPVVLIKTGSIQLKINQVNLMNYKCISPPEELLNKYSEYSSDIRKKLINNIEEIKKLTELRDWLLPMLMNGQVTIKDN